jgi:hypothetical protein
MLGTAVLITIAAQTKSVLADPIFDRSPPHIDGPVTPTADLADSITPYANPCRLRNHSSTKIVVELYSSALQVLGGRLV